MTTGCRLAIAGVTGEVGKAVLASLEEAGLVLAELHVLASAASTEETVMFNNRPLLVESLADFDFSRADIVIFAVPAAVAHEFVPKANRAGCRVIDHSAAFRLEAGVPLLVEGLSVPDVPLVACPDALTAILFPVLAAIGKVAEIESIEVTVLNPVSGVGRAGVREMAGQTGELLNARGITPEVFPVQIAFNTLPVVGEQAVGALMDELERLLPESFPVVLSEVRVPVFYGVTLSLSVHTRTGMGTESLHKLLQATGLKLADNESDQGVATPVTDASGNDGVYLSGLQALPAPLQGLQLWLVADNVRQGAARHSLHILKNWIKDFKY